MIPLFQLYAIFFTNFIRKSLFIFPLRKIVMLFMCVKIFYAFIMESSIIVFTRERLLMLLKFLRTVHKS